MRPQEMQHIVRQLIAHPQQWRERAVERVEPLSKNHYRRRISFQYRLTESVVGGLGAGVTRSSIEEARKQGWHQTIPLVRLPKGTLIEFSATNEKRDSISIKNHFDGSLLTRDFLMEHFFAMINDGHLEAPSEDTILAMKEYLYLVAAVSHESRMELQENQALERALVACEDPQEAAILLAAHLQKGMSEYVQTEVALLGDLIAQLIEYLQKSKSKAERLEQAGLLGIRAHVWADPVLNPLLMGKGYVRRMLRLKEQYGDNNQALKALLTIARHVGEVHQVAWDSRLRGLDNPSWIQWSGFFREVYLFVYGWILYADLHVRLEEPILVKLSWIDQIGGDGNTAHGYFQQFTIGPKDFLSKHFEIAAADPEIEIKNPQVLKVEGRTKEWTVARGRFREFAEAPPHSFHYIISDPLDEIPPGPISDWHKEFASGESIEVNRSHSLRVSIDVAKVVRHAYFWTAASMLGILLYAVTSALSLFQQGLVCPRDLEPVALATVAMLAVVILFGVSRHRSPLVSALVATETQVIMGAAVAAACILAAAALASSFDFLWNPGSCGVSRNVP